MERSKEPSICHPVQTRPTSQNGVLTQKIAKRKSTLESGRKIDVC